MHVFPVFVPRHALSPRRVVRAAEVWRLLQTAAVTASTRNGWPPERYVAEKTGFVVARMQTKHHREIRAGEPVTATTWVRDFRRGVLSRREIRLHIDGEEVAAATQQWVHVSDTLKPTRASAQMLADFAPTVTDAPVVRLPEFASATGPVWRFSFRCWHSWMDMLSHVNHPTYVGWCDESLMQRLAALGVDPRLVSVAEELQFKHAVQAGEEVTVESQLIGTTTDSAVIQHNITAEGGDGARRATAAITIRRLEGADLRAVLS